MRFCEKCDNMYYMRVNDTDGMLNYFCRYCGHIHNGNIETTVVSHINFKETNTNLQHEINEYTKNDPTIPVLNNIKCPNSLCISNTASEIARIRYVRYNHENLKYAYMCERCDYRWKND